MPEAVAWLSSVRHWMLSKSAEANSEVLGWGHMHCCSEIMDVFHQCPKSRAPPEIANVLAYSIILPACEGIQCTDQSPKLPCNPLLTAVSAGSLPNQDKQLFDKEEYQNGKSSIRTHHY
jgi:hypothetical protein